MGIIDVYWLNLFNNRIKPHFEHPIHLDKSIPKEERANLKRIVVAQALNEFLREPDYMNRKKK